MNYFTKETRAITSEKEGLLTIYFVRAVNDCVCCMSISDEVHSIFLTVQGSLWSDKEMDRERKPSKSSITKIWDLHKAALE